jgi:hypothetical protein
MRKKMSRVVRVSISFDYYPDEDELMLENNFTEEELIEYYKSAYVDDIYSFVKYNELYDAVDVEILPEAYQVVG